MSETVDEVVKPAPKGGAPVRTSVIEEEFDPGGGRVVADEERGEDVHADRGGDGRRLSDSVKSKIAAMFADEDDDDGTVTTEAPVEKVEAANANLPDAGEKAAVAKTPEEIAVQGTGSGDAELRATIERMNAASAKLVADLEAANKRSVELPERYKKLIEATENYVEDQPASLRHFIAAGLGLEDINDPAVDAEIRDLYADLTAKELGTSVDGTAHQVKREAARAKQLFAREKRQRKTDEGQASERAKAEAEAAQFAKAADYISGKVTAEAYPFLHVLAADIDGGSIGSVVAKILKREVETGRIDPKQPEDVLIKHAATIAETRYRDIATKAMGAQKPNPTSTERPIDPKSTAATSERTEQRQSHGARNLTAADASVAPAKPPATQPKTDEKRPKFRTRDEKINHSMRLLTKRT